MIFLNHIEITHSINVITVFGCGTHVERSFLVQAYLTCSQTTTSCIYCDVNENISRSGTTTNRKSTNTCSTTSMSYRVFQTIHRVPSGTWMCSV